MSQFDPELQNFANQQLGPEYRHVKDFITTAPPPGGYVVKASKNSETSPDYNPFGGDMKIVVDPHIAGGSFSFDIPKDPRKQEELKKITMQENVKQYPDDQQRENVITTLKTLTTPPAPVLASNPQNIVSPPPVNRNPEAAQLERESVLPLVDTELNFIGSPFSTEASFNDVFEDATKNWLFLVYYNKGANKAARTKITATELPLELKIKDREVGYKLDAREPIIAEFKDFSFIILKIIDAVVAN
jgi:hypothetical protein